MAGHTTGPFIDHSIENNARRDVGILGRGGNMGNGIFAIGVDSLPPEAKITINLIASNGPFPYSQDGTLFGNRFGDLPQPDHTEKKYLEFTVPTPGATNRGKRRILAHRSGALFFTACHYERVQGNMTLETRVTETEKVDAQWRNGFYVITGLDGDIRARVSAAVKTRFTALGL